MADAAEQLKTLVRDAVADGRLRKAVLSKPRDRASQVTRVDVRPVQLRDQLIYQFASRVGNQEIHRNITSDKAAAEILEQSETAFRDLTLQTRDANWTARCSKKGVWSLQRQNLSVPESTTAAPSHDRTRNYLIPDGVPVPFLVATGIMAPDGRVRSKQSRKFRQINRYVEFIRDTTDRLPPTGTVRVVDFGCGKSYLTFATHYFLSKVLNRDVLITGLDRRPDVIRTCEQIAAGLNLPGLRFQVGDIATFEPAEHIHLTISLHACDTATDDALASAVRWGSDVILAVPCCQHELAEKLPTDAQPVLSGHGILHERFCAMATDAVRASLLEQAGYATTVQEFIDMQHTAKNVLIRAVRRLPGSGQSERDAEAGKLRRFLSAFRIPPLSLQRQLEECGLLSPAANQSLQCQQA